VVDLLSDPPKIVWVEEGKLAQEERSLIWLDSTRLLISIPTSDDKGMAIETVKVDP
jgi:hypothetical protein